MQPIGILTLVLGLLAPDVLPNGTCTWSGTRGPSRTWLPFWAARALDMSPICRRSPPYGAFLRLLRDEHHAVLAVRHAVAKVVVVVHGYYLS